jgi:hypothetical protein
MMSKGWLQLLRSKETYYSVKETYDIDKRDLLQCQRELLLLRSVCKQACSARESLARVMRNGTVSKETYYSVKRDQLRL